jgi:CheY-like chemotaxis protein
MNNFSWHATRSCILFGTEVGHTSAPVLYEYDEGPLSEIRIVLQELTVDIVLTDYCMPEMTGYDLLKAIKVVNLLADFQLILSDKMKRN